MDTKNKFEQDLIDSSAYKNPEGQKAIDEAIARMHAAEKADNTGEVEKITLELAETLNRIAATPEGTLATPEFFTDMEKQFSERVEELDAFGIIDKADPKIMGIDGNEYYVPPWQKILTGFTTEKIELIKQLEKPILLLVPDGMSLKEYADKIKSKPSQSKPSILPWKMANDEISLNEDKDGTMISDAVQYQRDKAKHNGKTKYERLSEPEALGWQVYVVDGDDNVPTSTVEKSSDNLRAQFKSEGFGGLSAEANFALQIHGTIRGKPFDQEKYGLLLESYLPIFDYRGIVLYSGWDDSILFLNGDYPDTVEGSFGARRSVRIL